jgi:hypothetical protein
MSCLEWQKYWWKFEKAPNFVTRPVSNVDRRTPFGSEKKCGMHISVKCVVIAWYAWENCIERNCLKCWLIKVSAVRYMHACMHCVYKKGLVAILNDKEEQFRQNRLNYIHAVHYSLSHKHFVYRYIPKKTIPCLISCNVNVKPIKAISIKNKNHCIHKGLTYRFWYITFNFSCNIDGNTSVWSCEEF